MKVELIVCYGDNTWDTEIVDANKNDTGDDIVQTYLEKVCKCYPNVDIAFVGIYNTDYDSDE